MHSRRIQLSSTIFVLAVFISTSVFAVDDASLTRVHTGTVVSVSADTLVTQGLSGKKKEHTYVLASAVNVICETKPCKLTDIKVGDRVTVTVEKQQDGSTLATKIETRKVNS
jgi:ferredoxin-fold anticodon binding domain-containing protein